MSQGLRDMGLKLKVGSTDRVRRQGLGFKNKSEKIGIKPY